MKNQRNIKLSLVRASIFVYVLLGTPFLVQAAPLDPEKVVVVANLKAPVTLSVSELSRIFKMRQKVWRNGQPISVFVLSGSNEFHRVFVKENLNMSTTQLRHAWSRLIFSGTGSMPEEVDGTDKMLKRLYETPGAIGYLPLVMMNDSNLQQVTVTH
ncbi:hypothetical protein J3998_08095 [Thiomicrorhabdus sp. 6S2-11]|uniref:PBP domain-containing protein n=1 Tax=Thiomicrorhabdus marina TaxID=2818442 RepID=A0ABS3Q5E1_9GAMM|nr:hypothetical protein [Thiomicrorhabdus marina]MBO1927538.1 hypothetical protein [Thiomicrorhabdus marina]